MIFNIKLHEFSFELLKIRHEHRQALFLHLSELGSHQLVKLGIAWELVDERNKGAADFEQALTCTDIRDITHLKVGDIKELGKLKSVRRCLVKHNDKFAVSKHRPCRMALQKVVYILRNTRTVRTVFTHTLPEGKEEVCRVFVLKEQIDFINENKGISAFGSVLRDTV